MRRDPACGSPEHLVSRRSMLFNLLCGAAGVGAVSRFVHPAVAQQLQSQQKRVLIILLNGGLSQFESFDPKPKTATGGPFRAIPTSVPGIHICELMPATARQMHRLAIVRSVWAEKIPGSHAAARDYAETGRNPSQGVQYPLMGPVFSHLLAEDSVLPGSIHIAPGSSHRNDAAFLGPRHASVVLGGGRLPENLTGSGLSRGGDDSLRFAIRRRADERFLHRRRSAYTEAYNASYEQAEQLIQQQEIFDLSRESAADRARYGTHDFGRHCLLARRLLERGITCVKVTHSNYDSHMENFNFHLEQLGEFDQPFATLLQDLDERGMLETTLVAIVTEFGRTPEIRPDLGRDHWPANWSVALAGCGIQRGALIGKTNDDGTEISDRPVHVGDLFHTYLRAVGLDPTASYSGGANHIPIGAPERSAVDELLI